MRDPVQTAGPALGAFPSDIVDHWFDEGSYRCPVASGVAGGALLPPQISISVPVQTAVCPLRGVPEFEMDCQVSLEGS
ncbi:MAG: hypothetical protein L0191_14955 [Acidobacteria bacterium]|nr:hypothetical protein [Acidobacteriota bacterium]